MVSTVLKEIFDPYIVLDIQVWKNFADLGEIVVFSKDTVLKQADTTEKYFNLLLEGSGGNLIWVKNNYVCIDIALEKEFINDYMSFTLQQPTPIEVRLFEDSKLLRIRYEAFMKTMEDGHFGDRVTRLAAEASFISKQNQQIDLLTKTARQRYLELLGSRPGIDRLPLKFLASYLGITPQSLSRIRSEKI